MISLERTQKHHSIPILIVNSPYPYRNKLNEQNEKSSEIVIVSV